MRHVSCFDAVSMTYLGFHLVFNLPVLILLGFLSRNRLTRDHLKWIAVVLLIVMVFATVWDNLAIYKRFWSFDESRILFKIGFVPIEEYLFFVILTLQVCLLVTLFLPNPSAK